ncbi:uncharacterized protein [Diadema antillarum]|uniref:uncharacterized protein n=1 Tax=Diadema antillarum TaxID=105358 RepID=UPI003A850A95
MGASGSSEKSSRKTISHLVGRGPYRARNPDDMPIQPQQTPLSSTTPSTADLDDDLANLEFPYENIVMEGGGTQGPAYVGAFMELERLGYADKIHRFAGTSVGSMMATFLAVGHDCKRIAEETATGSKALDYMDASCGVLSAIPNVYRSYGWHPGRRLYETVCRMVEEKLGDRKATFKDLYDQTGRELCVVVTNISSMMEEYCHVKTTPNMPIAVAVRMSTAIPGVFQPYKRIFTGQADLYVDGGVICNYPVHCFDGWWLSMKPEDSYFRRMQDLEKIARLLMKEERFGTFNDKTFGMITFSEHESHTLPNKPELISTSAPLPNTKLARAHVELEASRKQTLRNHHRMTTAMNRFLQVLSENDVGENQTISLDELQNAIEKSGDKFSTEDAKVLFGEGATIDEIFKRLDINDDGSIHFEELMSFAQEAGIGIQSQYIGSGRNDIRSTSQFVGGIFQTLLTSVRRSFLAGNDTDRTVLINTVYVKSLDFRNEQEDMDYIIEQGRRGMRAFLTYQKEKGRLTPRKGVGREKGERRAGEVCASEISVIAESSSEMNSHV